MVAGRNGSGKSSISEALEFVLTGDTYRWKNRVSQWKEHWRNLHHDKAQISVTVVEEGRGPTTVTRDWDDQETSAARSTTVSQRQGDKKQSGLGDLGWERPLEQFRPILSYEELGGMLEGSPSELHDALAKVLGTEQLGDALKRIQVRLKQRKAPGDAATKRRKDLQTAASTSDDERAQQVAALLKKTSPDLDAIRHLVTGSNTLGHGPIAELRGLSSLEVPFTSETSAVVVERLRGAMAGLADAGSNVSERNLARLKLLEAAINVHADHGDMSCPVCRSATLDEDWAAASSNLVTQQRAELTDHAQARQTFELALAEARRLITPRPAILSYTSLPDLEDKIREARSAWDEWAKAPQGNTASAANELAEHLELYEAEVIARVADLKKAAGQKLTELDDRWQPLATDISAWCSIWAEWLLQKDSADVLSAAERWLKENELELKNDLLAPIRDGAKAAWAKLRQESNVEIGNLTLDGLGTRRKVSIEAQIDGSQTSSMAVLSQGELHALALALFLPRATMAQSPFRFVVLDDPVQAMDPAKVDGLVELLSELAETSQVIVLSHDDRLAAAVRRAEVDATILEVNRGKDSNVTIQTSTDPVNRYLDDAFAMITEQDHERLSEAALRRTLPGLLRFAAEAAGKDRYFTQALKHGATIADVESTWEDANTTRAKLALAIFGEPRENHELDNWARAPYRKFALRTVGSRMHTGLKEKLDPRDSAREVQKLI
ncbi:AAA family ATPase [Nocardioides sp. JQ2195]|uniref:AAA family ATPase n=1 Tax=Nocardioides sp. JQ2195 TaxID=2592334 RepID=UPI001F0DFF7C|nr:AAA family ATPase [Nocardioides sp. JQ2195]